MAKSLKRRDKLNIEAKSFKSLLASNKIYKVNPLDIDPNLSNMYPEWQEAQSRTFPNSVTLIKK